MSAKISFCYEKGSIEIQCSIEEEMKKIFQKYVNKINSNVNNFDFFYERKKISNDSTMLKLTGNRNKKNIIVFVERKSKIIKCPKCICNDTIIKIENFRLQFDGCKYKNSETIIFDDYEKSQEIDFSKIKCSKSGCKNNVKDDPDDFYKCIDCTTINNRTTYYCSKCNNKHTTNHRRIKYDEKNYYCEEHCKKLMNYCGSCDKDLCEDCKNDHNNHSIITYESMEEKTKNIRDNINKIKKSISDLEHVVENIRGFLDGSVNIIKKYCIIAENIINKYETFNKDLKNHRILQSVINLKESNEQVMEDIKSIMNNKNDIREQTKNLINIFILDREDYIKGSQNNINILKSSNGINN